MRQMVMLEKSDLDLLRAGETLTLRVGDAAVVLGLAGVRSQAAQQQATGADGNGARPEADGRVQCPICERAYKSARVTLMHARVVHKDLWQSLAARKSVKCPFCHTTVAGLRGLVSHGSHRHPDREPASLALLRQARGGASVGNGVRPTPGAAETCAVCEKGFPNAKRVLDHIIKCHRGEFRRVHRLGPPFRCPQCKTAWKSFGSVSRHVARMHGGGSVVNALLTVMKSKEAK